jgi:hypothetical protein
LWRLLAITALTAKSNSLMRTPKATEHHPSYDNEFLPSWPGGAAHRKS